MTIERGVILHQVNCVAATGGLAGALRRKWPRTFKRYFELCRDASTSVPGSESLLGCFAICSVPTGTEKHRNLWVAHIFGQVQPGPNTNLHSVQKSIAAFAEETPKHSWRNQPMYAPYKMGCGLGGGDWKAYSAILEHYLPDLTIVRKPGYDL